MTRTAPFCAVLALLGAFAGSVGNAEAGTWRHRHHGGHIGLGIAAAIIGGAAIAAAAAPRCRAVAIVDRWGDVVGYREVC